jgi:hypothetical protein
MSDEMSFDTLHFFNANIMNPLIFGGVCDTSGDPLVRSMMEVGDPPHCTVWRSPLRSIPGEGTVRSMKEAGEERLQRTISEWSTTCGIESCDDDDPGEGVLGGGFICNCPGAHLPLALM